MPFFHRFSTAFHSFHASFFRYISILVATSLSSSSAILLSSTLLGLDGRNPCSWLRASRKTRSRAPQPARPPGKPAPISWASTCGDRKLSMRTSCAARVRCIHLLMGLSACWCSCASLPVPTLLGRSGLGDGIVFERTGRVIRTKAPLGAAAPVVLDISTGATYTHIESSTPGSTATAAAPYAQVHTPAPVLFRDLGVVTAGRCLID